jgi:hypothetical protein
MVSRMVSRLGRLALMLLACAFASASEMAQLDDQTDSATLQTVQAVTHHSVDS